MSNNKGYILQTVVSPVDSQWIYPDLPKFTCPPKKSGKSESKPGSDGNDNNEFYLRHITFTEKLTIMLSVSPQKTNRILSSENSPFEHIIVVSFEKLRFPDNPKAPAEYIKKFLKTGIILSGKIFKFYGHSNSQLKSRTCYMYAEPNPQVLWGKINSFGDFKGIMSVAKRAKRIGLLFSAAEMGIKLNDKNTADIPDIESNGQVYTDGCGYISQRYAQELAKRSKIIYRDERYVPSVFQIRYKGYKGTLYVNPLLDKEFKSIKIQFRNSMQKFKNCPDDTFSILEYSKPYEFGKLNGEIVSLLSSLGISDETFLQKLTYHLKFIQEALNNEQCAFQYLSYHNQNKLAEKILLDGFTRDIKSKIRSLQSEDYKRFFKNNNEAKVHIMIPESRLLFGICDSTGKLEEDEIFLRVTKEGVGRVALAGAEVIVTRNPCLHPGDIQKFKCVHIEELDHLVDCVVFSTKGDRPAPSLMSGGDLDGDKFFVCWDKELIPSCLSEPYGYPPAKESIRRDINYEEMINYFAQYNNASLGRCKNLYLKWMKSKPEGARSKECQELNALFSSCVDGQPIKIPEHLQAPPENPAKKFILDLLCDRVKAEVTKKIQTEPSVELLNSLPMSIMDVLASTDALCLNEFELLQLVYRWTKFKKLPLIDYLPHFDFSSLTSLQKHWIENQIPLEHRRKWHGIIFNGLFTSQIITEQDLERHNLNSEDVNWQRLHGSPLFSSYLNNNNNIIGVKDSDKEYLVAKGMLQKALQLFQKKMIVIQVNSRFAYGIYINKRMEEGDLINLFQCCKLFAFTRSTQEHISSKFITERDYVLYFDGDVFQLFQSKRPNTFVYLRFGEMADDKRNKANSSRHQTPDKKQQKYKVTKNVYIQPRSENQQSVNEPSSGPGPGLKMFTSVALNRFSKGVQSYVGRVYREETQAIEIYVISNRDRVGHSILDISMNQVNTEQVYQIIQNIPNEYTIPSVHSIDFSSFRDSSPIPKILQNIQREANLISTLEPAQFFELCTICVKYDLKTHLEKIVDHTLKYHEQFNNENDSYGQILDIMMDLLDQAPYLSVLLKGCSNSADFRLRLCIASVKCANEYQMMALDLFKKTLDSMITSQQNLDAGTTGELIKLILFTVRGSDLAQDFILELFGQENKCIIDVGASDVHGLTANEYFKRYSLPLAMNYISEVQEKCPCDLFGKFTSVNGLMPTPVMKCLTVKEAPPPTSRKNDTGKDPLLFETILRVDCFYSIRNGDHMRLQSSSPPSDQPSRPLTIIDVVVDSIFNGCLKFKIQQQRPVELVTSSWDLYSGGSPTTLLTMMEAVQKITVEKEDSASSYMHIVDSKVQQEQGLEFWPRINEEQIEAFLASSPMNSSQLNAVKCALNNVTTLIWGPPGTGKTTVVVQIILAHLTFFPMKKILVTASTHNATDNILERVIDKYEILKMSNNSSSGSGSESPFVHMDIVRVTSEVSKVNKKLQKWTLDAFVGANLNENHKVRKEAVKRLKQAKVVFSTCSGAGVGLLRSDDLKFEVVIVDEASQLTEPNALVPVVKGSRRVVLVGDHVQLRPTVTELGKAYEGDTSLFERLYKDDSHNNGREAFVGKGKAMLDVQYRMHPILVQFPSNRFYEGRLKSGVSEVDRRLYCSDFPWAKIQIMPKNEAGDGGGKDPGGTESSLHPVAFVQCDHPETRGTSKRNIGQAKVVRDIIKQLRKTHSGTETSPTPTMTMKITVLTPYALQVKEIRQVLDSSHNAGVDVVTIDGFQGRESDIIIFCTVRCNKSGAVGFLEDYRRMNVALTRAKFGLIVIGDKNTLMGDSMWSAWFSQCKTVNDES